MKRIVQRMSDGTARFKDANKADKYVSMVQKIINRIDRGGDPKKNDPRRRDEFGRNAVALKQAIKNGEKLRATKLLAENARILKSLSKDLNDPKSNRNYAQILLSELKGVESDINAMES